MKKILVLFLSMILLTGCSAENGIITKKDIESTQYENLGPWLEKQKNIAIVPEDVSDFLSKLEDVRKENLHQEDSMGYLDINLNRFSEQQQLFLYETYLNDYANDKETAQFYKMLEVLDQTISKGILEFVNQNEKIDLKDKNINKKIGRTWIQISNPTEDRDSTNSKEAYPNDLKNDIKIWIKIRDIKDENYKKMVSNLIDDDLILTDLKVGEDRDLITLESIEFKNYYDVKKSTAISYNLFIKDYKIEKVRAVIVSTDDKEITKSDLQSLNKISNVLEFNSLDIKNLENIEEMIIKGKKKNSNMQSDNFTFKYNIIEDTLYEYDTESTKIVEFLIEKRK